jgi:hypothetical protein
MDILDIKSRLGRENVLGTRIVFRGLDRSCRYISAKCMYLRALLGCLELLVSPFLWRGILYQNLLWLGLTSVAGTALKERLGVLLSIITLKMGQW